MARPPINLKMNCVKLQSLRNHDFLLVLISFKELLASAIGPGGSVKVIESIGGIVVFTTSSKRLIEWIELNDPILLVICNAMKNQWEANADFGLFTGLTCTTLLLTVLKNCLPWSTVSFMMRYFVSMVLSLISELRESLKVDFSSVENLVNVVETVVTSKPFCCDPAVVNVSELAACVVGGFIRGMSGNHKAFGKISVVVDEGAMKEAPVNFTGLLYASPDSNPYRGMFLEEKSTIKVVLFVVNLTPCNRGGNTAGVDFDGALGGRQDETFLDMVERTCERFLASGVRIFACQKVIHPHLKLFLQRKGAVALERMGKDLADSFALLTGALPLGRPTFEGEPLGCIGEVESVEVMERGGTTYLRLGRNENNGGVVTIVVSAAGEQQAAELKVVIYQALQSLRHLVLKPFILPGAGCLETWLAVKLQTRVLTKLEEQCNQQNCSKVEMLAVLTCFRNTFLAVSQRIAGSSESSCMVDTFCNHRWLSLDAEKCSCGLLTKKICEDHGATWIEFEREATGESLMNFLSSENFSLLATDRKDEVNIFLRSVNLTKNSRVDVCSSKLNALSLALDICQSILNIGVVVY